MNASAGRRSMRFLPAWALLSTAKADEIDGTIKRLQAMSKGLRHAAACPAPSHDECATFQRLLQVAASGALEQRHKKRRVLNKLDRPCSHII